MAKKKKKLKRPNVTVLSQARFESANEPGKAYGTCHVEAHERTLREPRLAQAQKDKCIDDFARAYLSKLQRFGVSRADKSATIALLRLLDDVVLDKEDGEVLV
jgi:hypothetical protein